MCRELFAEGQLIHVDHDHECCRMKNRSCGKCVRGLLCHGCTLHWATSNTVVLLLTAGIRPEEARALSWDHMDLEAGTVAIWRSDRAGGDTKTVRSRRTLKLPEIALGALRERRAAQAADRLKAGELWQTMAHHGLLVIPKGGTIRLTDFLADGTP